MSKTKEEGIEKVDKEALILYTIKNSPLLIVIVLLGLLFKETLESNRLERQKTIEAINKQTESIDRNNNLLEIIRFKIGVRDSTDSTVVVLKN